MNTLIQLKKVFLVALACFGLLRTAQAVNPPPDGGYAGGNTAEGQTALLNLTTGGFNAAIGFLSLRSDTTGGFNTAIGAGTLLANTADKITAIGAGALLSNTIGADNTATGAFALFSNTEGSLNTATGVQALFRNTMGSNNTANGFQALGGNTSGNSNSAFGTAAMQLNNIGNSNTAVGESALFFNNADDNTALGEAALFSNDSGSDNTAVGGQALQGNRSGGANTASGFHALFSNITGAGNTANGDGALNSNTDGSGNTALGSGAGAAATGNSNVYIGAGMNGVAGESNACYIASIFSQTSASGVPVLINSNNKLGTATSSVRFKEDIKPMDNVSEALFALKPVTFRYKKEIDPAGISQLGLVAEEVDKVSPELVVRDKEGKPYSVRYDQVNAMLLNEFLKEHKAFLEERGKVENLEATVAQQQKSFQSKLAEQDKRIEALTSGLENVSARLEWDKTALRTVLNSP
jgi:hypothetical protein